jgi:hypothetical protein
LFSMVGFLRGAPDKSAQVGGPRQACDARLD